MEMQQLRWRCPNLNRTFFLPTILPLYNVPPDVQRGLIAGKSAQVQIPVGKNSNGVFLSGQPVRAHRDGPWWILDKDVTGAASIEAR
jgi:hypothetical protein